MPGQGLASGRDRARLRERELAERARVERVLARGPREGERRKTDRDEPARATDLRSDADLASSVATRVGCSCRVCGGREIVEDEVFDRGAWRVARCLRCEHRSMERIAVRFKPAVRRPVVQAGLERRANGA
jgi:hypothetical protein